MAIELKFHKTDNTPWGFRLTGGADYDVPITVLKVTFFYAYIKRLPNFVFIQLH